MTNEKNDELDDLKSEYEKLRKKYNLPDFYEINLIFDIEELNPKSELLLQKIRKAISEKIADYIRFIEVLLNPSNAPMFFFKLLKKLDSADKDKLNNLYEVLGKIEVESMILDLEHSEKNEAEFIKKAYEFYKSGLGEFILIVKKMGNGDSLRKKESNEGYFG